MILLICERIALAEQTFDKSMVSGTGLSGGGDEAEEEVWEEEHGQLGAQKWKD